VEKSIRRNRPPAWDSIESLAEFWDNHDLTDFDHDLEDVSSPVFVRNKSASLRVDLPAREAGRVKRIAQAKGVDESTVVRQWILERLHRRSDTVHSHRSGPQSARRKPRRASRLDRTAASSSQVDSRTVAKRQCSTGLPPSS